MSLQWIFIDPSAASFRQELRERRVRGLAEAQDVDRFNSVADGIRRTAMLFSLGRLRIHRSCKGLIRELSGYVWDGKAQKMGEDVPAKVADHGPDALRYLVNGTHNAWRNWGRS